MLFELGTLPLFLVLAALVFGSAAAGTAIGRRIKDHPDKSAESIGVVQGTLLGLVGLLLAFGLTMAVGRYDTRRALVVEEGNAIGTTYLRAQLLAEPARSDSLDLLREYADVAIRMAGHVPGSDAFEADSRRMGELHDQLWALAGDAVDGDPEATAPRLYVETLNETIDAHSSRVASLGNRVPSTVVVLQVVGSAIAIGILACYLAMLGRGLATSLVAAVVVVLILFISFDLDRPNRGPIKIPDGPLVAARADMDDPPSAGG